MKWFSKFVYSSFDKRSKFHSPPSKPPGVGVVVIASATPQQRLRRSDAVEFSVLFMTHIPIQAIGNCNTFWFWSMVSEPHGCLYIEIYFLIILFQITIYFQYVHDYFNAHLRCYVLCHYYMFYGRLRFYCILIVYAKFFMLTLFLLYLVRNDNNKDDQPIDYGPLVQNWYPYHMRICS